MTDENSYIENVISKTNLKVAKLKNNKTFYSIYNPEREIDFFCNNEKIKNSGFICIAGIGNGYHLKKISELYPEKFILAFEINQSSLNFLLSNNDFDFIKNSNIHLTTLNDLEKNITEFYNPILYGDFYFTYFKNWLDYHKEYFSVIENKINNSISNISADISTQSHFGKIWMHNIFENIKLMYDCKINNNFEIDNSKIAAIIGAGPSLDETILKLKYNTKKYFIISTDTAYPILCKNDIIPDVVTSIDAQIYSREHFIGIKNFKSSKTIFLLDLCCNKTIAKQLNPNQILFFNSGHPLCNYFEKLSNIKFLKLNSGRGTVTTTAFDFALECGFTNIELFGSDFCFYKNKPYAKTTYLEKQFLNKSNFINNLETQYSNLMFRTITEKNSSGYLTSQLLNEYCLTQQKMIKTCEKNIFSASTNCNPMKLKIFTDEIIYNKQNIVKFNLNYIDKNILKKYYQEIIKIKNIEKTPIFFTLLPFFAWGKQKKFDFFSTFNIAKNLIHNYTI